MADEKMSPREYIPPERVLPSSGGRRLNRGQCQAAESAFTGTMNVP